MLIIIIFTACNDFLDVKPKGKEIASDIEHYNGLFNNFQFINYMNYEPGAGGFSFSADAFPNLSVVMSGESLLASPHSNALSPKYRNAYSWADDVYLPDTDVPEWETFYLRNYTYNVIINEVMDATGGTEEEKRALLAEARANRALLHFMVLNFFSKPYDQSSASTDLGIPIITVPDADALGNTRNSVQEVYDFIISELKAAIPDLNEQTISRLRLARAAGKYILGQVYLFMGNYEDALPLLEDAKTLTQNSLVPIGLYDYNVKMSQWKISPIFPPFLPFALDDEEGIFQQRLSMPFAGQVFLNPEYESLYGTGDIRFANLFANSAFTFSGFKFYPYRTRVAPSQVNYGPSMPNLYLMLAECKARLGDLSGAEADIETFRSNRMPSANADVVVSSQDDLIRFIIDERFREYACTGLVWFDIRRLWNDPLFSDRTYMHTSIDGTTEHNLTFDRLLLRIPLKILQYNPDMQDNP